MKHINTVLHGLLQHISSIQKCIIMNGLGLNLLALGLTQKS